MRSYCCSSPDFRPQCSPRPTPFATWLCACTKSFSVFLPSRKNSASSRGNQGKRPGQPPSDPKYCVERTLLSAAVGVEVVAAVKSKPKTKIKPKSTAPDKSVRPHTYTVLGVSWRPCPQANLSIEDPCWSLSVRPV